MIRESQPVRSVPSPAVTCVRVPVAVAVAVTVVAVTVAVAAAVAVAVAVPVPVAVAVAVAVVAASGGVCIAENSAKVGPNELAQLVENIEMHSEFAVWMLFGWE